MRNQLRPAGERETNRCKADLPPLDSTVGLSEVQLTFENAPHGTVVNLGCGLDCTGRACDNGHCKIYNLDFPDVIAVRNQLLPAGERETNIPCDLNDTAWLDKIDASGGAVFFASGVFYYFLKEQVRILVRAMADAFPAAYLCSTPPTKRR